MLYLEDYALQEKLYPILFLLSIPDSIDYHRAILFYFKVSHVLFVSQTFGMEFISCVLNIELVSSN